MVFVVPPGGGGYEVDLVVTYFFPTPLFLSGTPREVKTGVDEMSFTSTNWKCASCGRTGTLCEQTVGVTILDRVVDIGNTVVSQEYTRRKGKFYGYVCCGCGMEVARTARELINQLGNYDENNRR